MWLTRVPLLRALHQPRIRVVVACSALATALLTSALALPATLANYGTDADVQRFFEATDRFSRGLQTYALPLITSPDRFLTGPATEPYPPTFFVVMGPLARLGSGRSLAWLAVELTALVMVPILIYAAIGWPAVAEAATAVALLLVLLPVRETLFEGQLGFVLCALCVGANWAALKGRPMFAGALLAAAVALKLTPALLLLYYLYRGRYRVFAWTVGWTMAIILLTLPLIGITRWLDFSRLMAVIERGTAFVGNQSIPGVILRAFRPDLSGQPIPAPPLALAILGLLLQAAALAALAVVIRIRRPGAQETWTEWSLVLLVIPLVQPFAWFHHWAMAIPFVLLMVRLAWTHRLPAKAASGLLVSIVLTFLAYPLYRVVRNLPGASLAGRPLLQVYSSIFFVAVVVAAISGGVVVRNQAARNG